MSQDLQSAADTNAQGSSSESHIKGFKEFINELNKACKVALPPSNRYYERTYALLIRWEDDNLGTEKEICELNDLFVNDFGYYTERYFIPSHNCYKELEFRLHLFRKTHDNDGKNLLILYYGGHGAIGPNHPNESIWVANSDPNCANLLWSDLQSILHQADSDVVLILDCCYAATATRATSSGSKEGLWASNSSVTTTGVNDNSFTKNLIAELKAAVQNAVSLSIVMLHQKLMVRFGAPGNDTSTNATLQGPKLLIEPWYTYLSPSHHDSVVLRPQSEQHVTTTNVDSTKDDVMVLLAVRLKSPDLIPSLETWNKWLHENCPDDVDDVHGIAPIKLRHLIRLQANFLSNSSLTLVSVPVFLFDRLPKHDAYRFVGLVRSDNQLLPKNEATSALSTFSVPFRRERKPITAPEVTTLMQMLSSDVSRAAVIGLGGVGKTRLANETCYRFREQHPDALVLWLDASTIRQFDQSIHKMAKSLHVRNIGDDDADVHVLIHDWLKSRHRRWLVVLDNITDIDEFERPLPGGPSVLQSRLDCIPLCVNGSTVITTRRRDIAERLVHQENVIELRRNHIKTHSGTKLALD